MSLWFSADSHFGHSRVIEYCKRPYKDVDEMNAALIRNWNAVVQPGDIVVHVGDVCMGLKEHWPSYLSQLKGDIYLTPGNHDLCDNKKHGENCQCRTSILGEYMTIRSTGDMYIHWEGFTFWAAHIPTDNGLDSRDFKRPAPTQPYDIAVCGHIHDLWKHRDKCVNVGVDVWKYRPVSALEIIAYYETKVLGL